MVAAKPSAAAVVTGSVAVAFAAVVVSAVVASAGAVSEAVVTEEVANEAMAKVVVAMAMAVVAAVGEIAPMATAMAVLEEEAVNLKQQSSLFLGEAALVTTSPSPRTTRRDRGRFSPPD